MLLAQFRPFLAQIRVAPPSFTGRFLGFTTTKYRCLWPPSAPDIDPGDGYPCGSGFFVGFYGDIIIGGVSLTILGLKQIKTYSGEVELDVACALFVGLLNVCSLDWVMGRPAFPKKAKE